MFDNFEYSETETGEQVPLTPQRRLARRRHKVLFSDSMDTNSLSTPGVPMLDTITIPDTPKGLPKVPTVRSARVRKSLQKIYFSGFVKDSTLKRIEIKPSTMKTEVVSTLTKGLLLLNLLIYDDHLEWLEWYSMLNIFAGALPEKDGIGNIVNTTRLIKNIRTNMTKTNRENTWYKLSTAIQCLGNEIPEMQKECENTIKKIYNRLKGMHFTKTLYTVKAWKKSLAGKPKKLTKTGSTMHYV